MTEWDRRAYGIVFVGPPGTFSVWKTTPSGELIDRDGIELLGQMASRAGAADYRVFELSDRPGPEDAFATTPNLLELEAVITAHAGVPPGANTTEIR